MRGRIGPRPYDLRHTFAVQRLSSWYRQGADLHARLPWLSAYMGHDDILGTETYLKKMLAEPFAAFTFSAAGASVYQLGSFGTARKELKALTLSP